MDLPTPTQAALAAYHDLTYDLSQWAPTAHDLVSKRIDALAEAYGPFDHPLETRQEYAERVLAHGQHPFPKGECLYDDLDNNTAYAHIAVWRDSADKGGFRITYTGSYPKWADDGGSYERRSAEIHVPSWLVTEPDGIERFRAQTAQMVADVVAERRRENAAIDAAIAAALDE